jgi:phosphoribosylanthranilate isomerase
MKVQIYTLQTPAEAQALVDLGVDHLGVTPAHRGLPGEVDFDTARAICAAIGQRATMVALSVESDPDAILAMVHAVRPDILHLCGLAGAVPPETVRALRAQLPNVAIMQAISITGPEAIETALTYQPVADYLILDTQASDIAGIGASGQTHDWNISRQIVERVSIPVILAGGLSPENVADAIRAVRPWGVDSLTRTNQPLPGGGFRKDIERVRQFVAAAQGALDV